jgi:biopolymer transport protein ExbB
VTLWALLLVAVMIYSLVFAIWWQGRRLMRDLGEVDLTAGSPGELQRRMTTFELDRMAWLERRLPFLSVLIAAAPLLGLLGTVAGMLISFDGLADGQGAAPIDTISAGISKALVTTQAGLVVAIPAAFLLALLKRQVDSFQSQIRERLHHALATRPEAV